MVDQIEAVLPDIFIRSLYPSSADGAAARKSMLKKVRSRYLESMCRTVPP